MKKYAITLFILSLIGIGLTVLLLTRDEKLDQTVFLETTESIRNLQILDKNFLVLLEQSRFNSAFDHEQLLDTNYQLSEEFSNLRFDALFEEIEASPALSKAVENFDDSYSSREEALDIYVEANSALASSLSDFSTARMQLAQLTAKELPADIATLLQRINSLVFALIQGTATNSDANELSDNLSTAIEDSGLGDQAIANTNALQQYADAFKVITDNQSDVEDSYTSLSSLQPGALLDSIEKEYVNYHTQAIAQSNFFRNALITYGIVLLAALAFFAAQIRRNYLYLEQQVADRTAEIESAYKELQESQEQLIQSEKMASLGQMVAGVAHEINTPLGYVSSNVDTLKYNLGDMSEVLDEVDKLLKAVTDKDRDNKIITQQMMKTLKKYRDMDANELSSESEQLLNDGAYGLEEISKLVISLKDFARLDRQSTEQVDIHECIDSSLTIASNHIRSNEVAIERQFLDLPRIACVPSKLNQLFLNIITNACQAMSGKGGTLSISTRQIDDSIAIEFTDEGIGMNEETQQKMFDPFFTTKEIGVGTGLGMSIAYKIIQAHNGSIEVDSTPGKGTRISVILPINQA